MFDLCLQSSCYLYPFITPQLTPRTRLALHCQHTTPLLLYGSVSVFPSRLLGSRLVIMVFPSALWNMIVLWSGGSQWLVFWWSGSDVILFFGLNDVEGELINCQVIRAGSTLSCHIIINTPGNRKWNFLSITLKRVCVVFCLWSFCRFKLVTKVKLAV